VGVCFAYHSDLSLSNLVSSSLSFLSEEDGEGDAISAWVGRSTYVLASTTVQARFGMATKGGGEKKAALCYHRPCLNVT
jgi:hypothetical protein